MRSQASSKLLERLSFLSWQTVSITTAGSTWVRALSAPTSLAKAILSAWNALQAYFTISAARSSIKHGLTLKDAYREASAWTEAESAPPNTIKDGSRKSCTAAPSRKNSG